MKGLHGIKTLHSALPHNTSAEVLLSLAYCAQGQHTGHTWDHRQVFDSLGSQDRQAHSSTLRYAEGDLVLFTILCGRLTYPSIFALPFHLGRGRWVSCYVGFVPLAGLQSCQPVSLMLRHCLYAVDINILNFCWLLRSLEDLLQVCEHLLHRNFV